MMIQINNFVIVIIISAINSKSVVIFAAVGRSIFVRDEKLTTFLEPQVILLSIQ